MFLALLVCVCALPLAGGSITGQSPYAGQCLCFTSSNVNVRASACGPVIGSANNGQCFTAKGQKQSCSLGGTTYEFHSFDFNGQTGWAAGNYLNSAPSSSCGGSTGGSATGRCSQANIVSRSAWGARAPRSRSYISGSVSLVFIHHTTGSGCTSQSSCSSKMRGFQNYHMDTRGWSDIGYSWLVGEDGNVYEGRGWGTQGAHTKGYNSRSYAISVIGDFTSRVPNSKALAAIKNIIACGVDKGKMKAGYKLYGHKDAGCTSCPGNSLYSEIRTWTEYSFTPITKNC